MLKDTGSKDESASLPKQLSTLSLSHAFASPFSREGVHQDQDSLEVISGCYI